MSRMVSCSSATKSDLQIVNLHQRDPCTCCDEPRLKKRNLVLSGVGVSVIFLMAVLCCRSLRTLMWAWVFSDSPASPLFEELLESHAAVNCHRRPPLAGSWWFYCGPQNGADFTRPPRDVLDTICAQHDYCIEKSKYYVQGHHRLLYPIGTVDSDNFMRCGIPVRSHTNPSYGCQISACDREMLQSLEQGFRCSESSFLPKSPWCQDARVLGKQYCQEYKWTWRYTPCRVSAYVAKAYHKWKLSTSCRRMDGPQVCRGSMRTYNNNLCSLITHVHKDVRARVCPRACIVA